jgi:hypothetical protein
LAGLSNRLDTSDKCKGLAGGPLLHTRIRHDLYSTAVDDCGVTQFVDCTFASQLGETDQENHRDNGHNQSSDFIVVERSLEEQNTYTGQEQAPLIGSIQRV